MNPTSVKRTQAAKSIVATLLDVAVTSIEDTSDIVPGDWALDLVIGFVNQRFKPGDLDALEGARPAAAGHISSLQNLVATQGIHHLYSRDAYRWGALQAMQGVVTNAVLHPEVDPELTDDALANLRTFISYPTSAASAHALIKAVLDRQDPPIRRPRVEAGFRSTVKSHLRGDFLIDLSHTPEHQKLGEIVAQSVGHQLQEAKTGTFEDVFADPLSAGIYVAGFAQVFGFYAKELIGRLSHIREAVVEPV